MIFQCIALRIFSKLGQKRGAVHLLSATFVFWAVGRSGQAQSRVQKDKPLKLVLQDVVISRR